MVPRMTPAPPAAPPPPPSGSDRWRLLVLLAVAAAVHWWVVANTCVTARDSIGFARYALALGDSTRSRSNVLREQAHPPGYPLAVLVVSRLIPTHGPLTEHMLLAAQVASSVAGVLIVIPVYRLGRRLFSPAAGFWSAMLLQFLPVFARDTADGLSDGLFLFFAVSAISCRVRAIDRTRAWPWLLACGLLSGLAYLVRPEGVLVPLAAVATLLPRVRRAGFARTAGAVAALAIGFATPAAPYMAVIGDFTNKRAMKDDAKEEVREDARAPAGGPVFAETVPDPRAVWTGLITAKEWWKVGHYGVAIYAVIGLAMTVRRVWREPRFWLPVLYAVGQLAVVLVLGFRKGYVSERHLLPVVTVGVLFAAGGMPAWFALWAGLADRVGLTGLGRVTRGEWWPWVLCAVGVGFGSVPVLNTRLHEDRLGHKTAGEELRQAIDALPDDQKKGVVVIDHYQWCQFFSGEATTAIKPDPPEADQRVVFVVLEFKYGEPESPDFNSTRHQMAVNYYRSPPGGVPPEWVYPAEPGHPNSRTRVVLLKITLPPK